MVQAVIIVAAVYIPAGPAAMASDTIAPAPSDGPLEDLVGAHRVLGRPSSLIQRSAAGVVLVVVVVLGVIIFGPQFANTGNFANLAVASSFLAIVAIGMTFVIISGGIDLSVGSLYALAAVLAAYGSRWGSLAGIVLPLVACGAIGLVQGALIGKLADAAVHRHPGRLCCSPAGWPSRSPTTATPPTSSTGSVSMTNLGQERLLGVGVSVLIALALYGVGLVVLNRPVSGRPSSRSAVGGCRVLMGLRVARVKIVLPHADRLARRSVRDARRRQVVVGALDDRAAGSSWRRSLPS